MKLSVKKWGAILAVILLGVGLARHATSSSRGAGGYAPEEQQVMIADWAVTVPSSRPAEPVVDPLLMSPLSANRRMTPIVLPPPTKDESPDLIVLDRLPEPPDLNGSQSAMDEAAMDETLQPSSPQVPAPPAMDTAFDPQDAVSSKLDELAPVTEEEARTAVLSMLGGEEDYFLGESDMAHAYAAAKLALRQQGMSLSDVKALAIIDFTLPSFDRRLALYDPLTGEESRHLVAHGHHSGQLYAESFSNTPGSLQSSPGLYRVGRHYDGEHGRAIRLHGLQKRINDLAYQRDVVLHAAWYVSYRTILENQVELGVPRIGRSHGCPAVSADDLPQVLQELQPGSYLFIHPVPSHVTTPQPEIVGNDGSFR